MKPTNKLNLKTKHFIYILAVLFATSCGVSYKEAKQNMANHQWAEAASNMASVSSSSKNSREIRDSATYQAAQCYRMYNNYRKAEKWYLKSIKRDPRNADAYYRLAIMYQNQEKYRDALKYFNKYLEEVPGEPKALNKKAGCELALAWVEDSSRFKVDIFKRPNSSSNDFAPMIGSKKDNVLYFTTDRERGVGKKVYGGTLQNFQDVWKISKVGRRGKKKWSKPVLVEGGLNAKYNDGVVSFDRRYSTAYFTRCNSTTGKVAYCKIYMAKKKGKDGWGEAEILPFCKDSFNYQHPAVSPDGKTIYFSSDREGGEGMYDIWMSNYIRRGRTWSEPINLGPAVNTETDEFFPYYGKHDNNIYFSSNGHPGYGGLDIFKIEGSGTDWSKPENLSKPINSGGDDFGICFDNLPDKNGAYSHGYFSSNRTKSKLDDIYEFHLDPILVNLIGIVRDCKNNAPLKNSIVTITNNIDSSKIILKTDENGMYETPLKLNTKYELYATNKELYYFDSKKEALSTEGLKFSKEYQQDFCLVYPTIQALPIYFDLDKDFIRPDAAMVLDNFIKDVLNKYPKLTIELGSHTDCRSSYAYNKDLSQRRANSSIKYLVEKGINPLRLEAKGYGESELMNDCQCEKGGFTEGYTKYTPGVTKKQVKISEGVYEFQEYSSAEIVNRNGGQYVPCDEYQHSQNRRTTIKFTGKTFAGRINNSQDNNNTNSSGNTNNAALEGEIRSTYLDSLKRIKEARDNAKDNAKKSMDNSKDDKNFVKWGTNQKGEKLDSNGNPIDPNAPVEVVIPEGAKEIKFTEDDGKKILTTMINEKHSQTWIFDAKSRRTMVTEELAETLYKAKIITKADFPVKDKIKTKNGVKLPGKYFYIQILDINGVIANKIKVTISPKINTPTLGRDIIRKFKAGPIYKDGKMYVVPKKPRKKRR